MYEDKYMEYKKPALIQNYQEFMVSYESGPFSPLGGTVGRPAGPPT
jgi:hypothetical protein